MKIISIQGSIFGTRDFPFLLSWVLLAKFKQFVKWCEKHRSHVAVVTRGMMFSPVIAVVSGTGAPVKFELFLVDASVS